MKTKFALATTFMIALIMIGCTGGDEDSLESKKAKLETYKTEKHDLEGKIIELEKEIRLEEGNPEIQFKPVRTQEIVLTTFKNPVVVQGLVESDENVIVSTEYGGKILSIGMEEGQSVNKGQVILSIDDDILQNQLTELRNELDLAEKTFIRQENLWNRNIGSELDYLQAKNRKDGLVNRIETLKSQISKYRITAPITGIVDEVFVNEGEILPMGSPVARVVNAKKVKITAEVSEKYIGKFKKGDSVKVNFPNLGKTLLSKIKAIGQVIDKDNRTFKMVLELKNGNGWLKPNLLAKITAYDLVVEKAVVVPTRILMKNGQQDYLYISDSSATDTLIRAKRVDVSLGFSGTGKSIVNEGLKAGDIVITEGFININDGDAIKIITE